MANVRTARLTERDWKIWNHYCLGRSQSKIASELGVSQQLISQRLKIIKANLPDPDRDELRKQHLEKIRWATEKLAELAEMDGVPVTAGKDGDLVYDPESGELARDYGGKITAMRELRAFLERQSKLMGLDAPTKVDASVEITVPPSGVDAEIVQLTAELGMLPAPTEEQLSETP